MNPCRCGWWGDPDHACRCRPGEPEGYIRRVSGPLLDRLDLRVEMSRVSASELLADTSPEGSATVERRIAAARSIAFARNGGRLNGGLTGREAQDACRIDPAARTLLGTIAERRSLTARGVHRILRVARTIADLSGGEIVRSDAILAAADLRDPAAAVEPRIAA